MNREEVVARIEAYEARVASSLDGLRAENAAFRADISKDFGAIQTEMAANRAENAEFRADLKIAFSALRASSAEMESRIIKWVIATALAATALAVGASKLFH